MYATQSRSTQTTTKSHLPTPLDALTALARVSHCAIPQTLRQQAVAMALNRAFAPAIAQGELDFMLGRQVRIVVSDIQLDFSVALFGQQFDVTMHSVAPDVILRAALPDLLGVIAGDLDPDTLFFRRKLTIEGDTELGLALKNFLDSQDPGQLIPVPAYRLVKHLASTRR